MKLRKSLLLTLSTAVLVLIIASPRVFAVPPAIVDLRRVALSNTVAPGTGGQIFAPFSGIGGQINNQGRILIGGSTQTSSGARPGLWFESSPGLMSLVALHNNSAPGVGAGKTYDYQGNTGGRINSNGDYAYTFGYKPFPVDNVGLHASGIGTGLWSTTGGSGLRVVAADSLPFPTNSAGPNLYYVGGNGLVLNNTGQISFNSYDGTNDHLWIDTPNQAPREVVNTLSAVPGVPGGRFDYLGPPMLSDTGRSTFTAALEVGLGGVTDTTVAGLWQENGAGTLQLIARSGQPAPEMGGQNFANYGFLNGLTENVAGQMAFCALLQGGPHGRVMYVQDSSLVLHKVVSDGDQAFGVPGATFVNLYGPSINDAGKVAFYAADSTAQPPGYANGLWSNTSGSYQPVVRLGQALPGMPPGTVVSYFNGMEFNNKGQVMVGVDYGVSLGGGNYTYVGTGIWAQDASGVFHPIISNGDLVDVDPSAVVSLRTVSFIDADFYTANKNYNTRFNDLGQILLSLDFTDGSHGLFVSNAVAVPEPVGIAFLAMFAASVGASRTRPRRGFCRRPKDF